MISKRITKKQKTSSTPEEEIFPLKQLIQGLVLGLLIGVIIGHLMF